MQDQLSKFSALSYIESSFYIIFSNWVSNSLIWLSAIYWMHNVHIVHKTRDWNTIENKKIKRTAESMTSWLDECNDRASWRRQTMTVGSLLPSTRKSSQNNQWNPLVFFFLFAMKHDVVVNADAPWFPLMITCHFQMESCYRQQ